MKKYIYITFVACLTLVTSCKKGFLDQVPDDRLTLEETFKSRATAEKFLSNVYSWIPDEFGQRGPDLTKNAGLWTGGSDEAEYVWGFAQTNNLNIGNWDANSSFVNDYWNNFYKGIRSATFFMANIDKVKQDITPQLINQYKAEARALRAMYYFYLVRLYGPVVLLGEQVIPPDAPSQSIRLPRSSFDECIDFITSELQTAADILPTNPSNNDNYGRITKGMALSYRLQAYLLAASPLFNGNADLASLKNKDGKQLVNQTYDQNKWKIAADAYKAYITQFVPGTYSLFKKYKAGGALDPYLSCRDLFLADDRFNNEIIMSRLDASIEGRQYEMAPYHNGYPQEVKGSGGLGATQNQVDAFFTANGRSIDDPLSGYVSTGTSSFQAPGSPIATDTYNQWVNREPRFYVNITYHNSVWLNTSFGHIITEFNNNGNSGKATGGGDYSVTGYAVRKAMGLGNWRENSRPVILYRVGNLFLDYVEALNESSPGDADILYYLNQIRERAGVPLYGSATLPAPVGKDAMREAIVKERRSELAFENVRFFDTRRWKIAEITDNGPIYGLNISKNLPDFFIKTVFENRVFNKRHYLFPIPSKDVNSVDLMVQNPGW